MRRVVPQALPLLLAALAAGCVQGAYNRATVDEPLRPEWLAALQPGRDSLGDCLQRLGAPHRVFEYAVEADGRSGMALLWVWRDIAGFGIDARLGDWMFRLAPARASAWFAALARRRRARQRHLSTRSER